MSSMDNVEDIPVQKEVEHTVIVVEEEHQNEQHYGKYVGQCKWFNDTYGYGFITVCDGEEKGKDVFVHHSGIRPLNSNYRTLKKGEYLTFDLEAGAKGLQAVNVKGINGGPLMCDCMASTKPTFYNHSLSTERHLPQTQRTQRQSWTPTPQEAVTNNHEIDSPQAPRPLKGKLASVPPQMYAQGQWLVMTKSGRVKNLAKYSKDGRTAMKQAKQNGFVPPYRKFFPKPAPVSNENTSTQS